MMEKFGWFCFFVVLAVFFAGCKHQEIAVTNFRLDKVSLENVSHINEDYVDCNITKIEKAVNGHSMEPMVKDEQTVILLQNYYKCNRPEKGDIVAYDYKGNNNPVIKIVKVTQDDFVEIGEGNVLIVNNETLKNSNNQTYKFSQKELKMLELYIKNNRIPDNSYFIFGDNVCASLDSRNFGAVSPENFLGKFELEK